jgi:hypothetical protein
MIVELRSRRNRSLPPPHRELLQVHERLAASVCSTPHLWMRQRQPSLKDGRASLLRIHPQPMTKEQAIAWLADFEL